MSRQDDVKRLLINYNRRLQALKERKALYGLDTPVAILTEIQDIETEIGELQTELKELENSAKLIPQTKEAISSDTRRIVVNQMMKGNSLWLWIGVAMSVLVMIIGAVTFFVNQITQLPKTVNPTLSTNTPPIPLPTNISALPTDTPTPSLKPSLVSPADNATFTREESIDFKWSWPPEAETAVDHFSVHMKSDFSDWFVLYGNAASGQRAIQAGFPEASGTYYWKVTAYIGSNVYTSEVRAIHFLVDNSTRTPTPIPWPILIAPEDKAVFAGSERTAVVLRWDWPQKDGEKVKYFNIYMKSDFTDWYVLLGNANPDERSSQWNFQEVTGTYYWKVTAFTNSNVYTSEVRAIEFLADK